MSERLAELVAAELAVPVDPRVTAMAAAIAAQHPGARAVLFYGSCLRETQLDGLMLDFYLIVADYRTAFAKRWMATANRLLPPNVFPFEQGGLAAKYAVLSEADFARLNRPEADSVSVWARFAQPTRLVWCADAAAVAAVAAAVAEAPVTLFTLARPMLAGAADDAVAIWRRGFALTYGAELRAERSSRPGSIVDHDPERYARFGAAALAVITARGGVPLSPAAAAARWRSLARRGKLLTIARLAKASATFAGGIDYLAWKVNRHAGTRIEIRPWQRRHPILGALTILPRLLTSRAVR